VSKHVALINGILIRFPRKELRFIFAKLKLVILPLDSVLSEASKPVRSAYFLREGLASILTVLADGKSVEVGLIGWKRGRSMNSVVPSAGNSSFTELIDSSFLKT
jgi:CRP-like cAMP-binding protein